MSDLARVTVASRSGCLVAAVSGEIDMSNVADVGEQLRGALGTDASAAAVLDLATVTYLDSAAMALLDELAATLRTADRALRLVAPGAGIAGRVLHLVGLDAVLSLDETLEDALAAIHGGGERPRPGRRTDVDQ